MSQANPQMDIPWTEINHLLQHIETTHHSYLKAELPLLQQLVSKIARVHGPNDGESLYELEKAFQLLEQHLTEHVNIQESQLFPLLRSSVENGVQPTTESISSIKATLQQMTDTIEDLLKQIRQITSNYTLPAHACRTYTLTFHKLEELESDLFTHLHLENHIFLPRLDAVIN